MGRQGSRLLCIDFHLFDPSIGKVAIIDEGEVRGGQVLGLQAWPARQVAEGQAADVRPLPDHPAAAWLPGELVQGKRRLNRRFAGLGLPIQFLMPAQGDWIRLVWPALL